MEEIENAHGACNFQFDALTKSSSLSSEVIFRACVQRVLTYGTETWAMKAENLHSLERAEHMMVRWMCEVSLKDRKRSKVLYSLLGVQSVAEVWQIEMVWAFGT